MEMTTTNKSRGAKPALHATVIYDDLDGATQAAVLLKQATTRADAATPCEVKPWRLDWLEHPELGAAAGAAAAGADLIVFAIRKTHSAPEKLMKWLENWALHRRVRDAAVVLLSGGHAAVVSFGARIEQFAAWHQLTVLSDRPR
ncbi:MAG: hypothetical protein ABSE16_09415 [Verrucomicrobiota bacterium]|jgi:hypothetical protein